jgi:hypothetical protein
MKTLRFHWRALAFLQNHANMRRRLLKYGLGLTGAGIEQALVIVDRFLQLHSGTDADTARFFSTQSAAIRSIIVVKGAERKAEKLFNELLTEANEILNHDTNIQQTGI